MKYSLDDGFWIYSGHGCICILASYPMEYVTVSNVCGSLSGSIDDEFVIG